MNPEAKIYVAGHRGLVGSAIVRALRRAGYRHLVLRTHAELDLTNQAAVHRFFDQRKPALRLAGGRESWRNSRQQQLPGGLHGPESAHSDKRNRQRPQSRSRSLAFSRVKLYLSQARPSADRRRLSAGGSSRAHQSSLRGGQDRRNRNVLVLQPPVRHPLSWRRCPPIFTGRATTTMSRHRT